jgi:predicted ATPase
MPKRTKPYLLQAALRPGVEIDYDARGNGIYLLDEPEAALSPSRQLAALSAIHQLVDDSSNIRCSTLAMSPRKHSPEGTP